MSKPSWFDSTNHIADISLNSSSYLLLGSARNLRMVRCLWLLSFVQDTRTFMERFRKLYNNGLSHLSAVQEAVLLLRTPVAGGDGISQSGQYEASSSDAEATRVSYLFFICVVLQTARPEAPAINLSPYLSQQPPPSVLNNHLAERLDGFLREQQGRWRGSVPQLYALLFKEFIDGLETARIAEYATRMADVLVSMGPEACDGVKMCLLNILLNQASDVGKTYLAHCDETPDSLLSSLHIS